LLILSRARGLYPLLALISEVAERG
jgi:hypothetical protein